MNKDTALRLVHSLVAGCLAAQAVCLYFAFTAAPVDVLHNGIVVGAILGAGAVAYRLQRKAQ